MYDFGIFCHLLRLMGIYRVEPPSGYLKSVVLSLSLCLCLSVCLSVSLSLSLSVSFIFFLSFFFFFCLSFGGPFSSGAPGYCPPMPPSRYATGTGGSKNVRGAQSCGSPCTYEAISKCQFTGGLGF